MAEDILTFAAHGRFFADEAYLARYFRAAKIKSRDARRMRIVHGEIPDNHTSLTEYQHAYRTYMNARRKHRMGEETLEQRPKGPEQSPTKPKTQKANIPKKGVKTVHGQWINGRWWAARAPNEPWPEGTFDCVPFGPQGWVSQIEKEKVEARKPKSPRLQRRPFGRLRVSTNIRPDKLGEMPG